MSDPKEYIWRKRRVYGEDDGPWPPPDNYYNNANEASIEQIKAALEEIGKGIDLIDFSGPAADQNIAAVTKIIWPELKRAFAALTRMEQP